MNQSINKTKPYRSMLAGSIFTMYVTESVLSSVVEKIFYICEEYITLNVHMVKIDTCNMHGKKILPSWNKI